MDLTVANITDLSNRSTTNAFKTGVRFLHVRAHEVCGNGTPRHPSELRQHSRLFYRTPVGPQSWFYQQDDQWHTAAVPEAAISNSGRWLAYKAVNGEGVMMSPRWTLTDYIQRGELQILPIEPKLKITQNSDLAVFLLYQKQRYLVPKVKVAVDFLVATIKGKY
ncbi:MAG: DNA-binding transcriptional LysR family regulator [Cryomorphaceae bacterium]